MEFNMLKSTRRESREAAFSLLFEWSFKEESLEEIIEAASVARDAKIDGFARELAEKTIVSREEIDALIEQYSQGRKLSRISKTALAVLRLCFCELTQFKDIPAGATINEGVELLKKYGTDEEAAYLNGILGSFEREGKDPKPTSSTQVIQKINIHSEQNTHSGSDTKDDIYQDVELVDDITIEVE